MRLEVAPPQGSAARLPRRTLARLFLGLVLAVLLPALGLGAAVAWRAVESHREAAEGRLRDTAQALALTLDREIAGNIAALTALAASPAFGPDPAAPDLPALDAHARRVAAQIGDPIFVVRRDGVRVTSTRLPPGAPTPRVNTTAMVEQVFATARPAVSDLLTGSISGLKVFSIGVPVPDAEGRPALVAGASFEARRLRALIAGQSLPEHAFAVVTDAAGVLAARSDARHDALVGTPIPAVNQASFRARTAGRYRAPALNGVPHVFAFHAVSAAPGWYVFVAQPAEVFDAAWRQPLLALALGGAAALLLGGLHAALTARRVLAPLERLSAHALAVAEDGGAEAVTAAALPPLPVAELEALRRGFAAAEAALRRRAAEERDAAVALAASEARLAASEAQLRTIVQTVPVGLVIAELPSGRIVGGNAHVETMLRHPVPHSPDIHGYDEWVAFHADGTRVDGHEYPLARMVLAGEENPSIEVLYQRGDGTRAWTRIMGRPVRDASGALVGGVVALVDVDRERRAQEALAEREGFLRLSQEHAGIASFVLDPRSGVLRCAPGGMRLFGFAPDRDSMTLEEWHAAIHPGDADRVAAQRAAALGRGETSALFEYRVVRPDTGAVRHVEMRARAEYAADGTPLRVLGVAIDVTERKRVEAALAESEARLRLAQEAAGVGIFECDLATGETHWSATMYALHGLDPAAPAPGMGIDGPHLDLVHEEDRAGLRAARAALAADPAATRFAFDFRIRRADTGEVRWIASRGEFIRDPRDGRPVRVRGAQQDVTERREAEARARDLLATLDLGTFIARDLDGTIRYWSAGCERLYGWTAAEAVGRNVHDLLRTVFPVPLAEVEAALARDGAWQGDLRHAARDGRALVVAARKVLRRDAAGRPVAVLEALTDVTAHRATEAALAASEARFRALAEAMPALLFETDAEGANIYVNQRFAEFAGLPAEALLGAGWAQVLHPDDRPQAAAAWQAAVASGGLYAAEFRMRRQDGAWRWFLWRGVPVPDAQGRIARWVGTGADIDDLRQAEAALREGEARLQLALEAGGMGFWSWDLASDRLDWDARQFALFGLDPAAGQPTSAAALARVHPADLPTLRASIEAALAAGDGIFRHEFRVCRREGGWRWIAGYGHAVPDATGRALRMVGLNFDVTDTVVAREVLTREAEQLDRLAEARGRALAESETRLAQAARMEALGRLAGGIAHDFNNVLQAVQGGLALAARRLPRDPEAARRYLGLASEAAGRGAAVTGRLLSFARRGELQAEPLAAGPLLAGLAELLRPALGPNIALGIEVPPDLPELLADRSQLEAVLVNLANNARDAMPRGGTLTLRADEAVPSGGFEPPHGIAPGAYVRISVVDEGEGMPPEVLARVTEPFFTTKPQGKGTGLGLAMARGFAEQSGGGLTIESAPDQGTAVAIWLPRLPPRTSRPRPDLPARPAEAASGQGLAVLLAEDKPEVRAVLAAQLEDQGYRVQAAEDARAALDRIEAGFRPDALVTDLAMPGALDGLDLVREARSRLPRLPAVLVTGHAGEAGQGRLEMAEQGGPFALLRKPAAPEALFDRLARVLRQAGIAAQAR